MPDGRGAILHAGFFVGNHAFYRELRDMPRAELEEIAMTAISFTNTLHGDADLKRAQRPHARFVNTAMVATLLGAVSSDQLEDGRVVSGPGGQHDLVAMAHELDGARSIIAVRSTRRQNRKTVSNIVWRYANATRAAGACATSSSPSTASPTSGAKATATPSPRCWAWPTAPSSRG